LGLRFDHATLIQEGEFSPRFSLWYKLDDETNLEGSWGVFYQYPDPLTISIRDQPLNIGGNLEAISAEKATHSVISARRKLAQNFSASLALYNVDLDRLLLPEDRITYNPYNDGWGILRGLEFVLEKSPAPSHRGSGLISYSYGRAQFRHRHSRTWTAFNYDRRHGVTLWYNHALGRHWQFSLLWRYASGLPYTAVVGVRVYEGAEGVGWDYVRSGRNAKRLPAYQRLDARLSYQVYSENRRMAFYLDFINLYNYQNVYNLTWEKISGLEVGSPYDIAKSRTIYMLPFLPSVGMQFVF
jgi:hypothetical protein